MARPKPSRRALPPKPEMSPEAVAAVRAELESRLDHIRDVIIRKRLQYRAHPFDDPAPTGPRWEP